VSEVAARDSSAIRSTAAQISPGLQASVALTHHRLLEVIPGIVTWMLILAPIPLSFRFPQVVGWFVLAFDCYWLYRAAELSVSVGISFRRVRRVMAVDWRQRAFALADPAGRYEELTGLIEAVKARSATLSKSGNKLAAKGGRRELRRLEDEQRTIRRLLKRKDQGPLPDPRQLWHVALVPTYTEPYEKLYETVRALAESDYPRDLRMVAIITRETDLAGREHVARLREAFGSQFKHFFHILDPLEPGVVVGKSSAMAYGGRWLYRELTKLGYDPVKVVVTDLDSDYRIHPQYFGYLTATFIADPDRYHRLYQPIPMFHNNLWDCPLPVRLIAVSTTHVQMWRHLTPERLVSFSSYAVSLQTVHEIDYWATDAIPEDSRFYWKSFFRYEGGFQAVPLFLPVYGDAVRGRSYPRSLVQQYTQIRRWAWGVTDIPYFIENAMSHGEIPLRKKIGRLAALWWDHINWAIAPFILVLGPTLPLLLNDTFRPTTLGQQLPIYAGWLLTGAMACLIVLIFIEDQLAPPRPKTWGIGMKVLSWVQWVFLPIVGAIFTNMPALDAQTRLLTGRYLEYRVTEKA
jgi:cellulose synthase/poly-beta-1,6-N-acetylglucosamine synthase-like glycosyltransferase